MSEHFKSKEEQDAAARALGFDDTAAVLVELRRILFANSWKAMQEARRLVEKVVER